MAFPTEVRRRSLEFLLSSSEQLRVSPVVKYTALALFAGRFLRSSSWLIQKAEIRSWLLNPLNECTLQLFALISLWISSKKHDTSPLSMRTLKSLADVVISDQHFAMRDFTEGEMVFMKILGFEIGAADIAFIYLEDLLYRFRQTAIVGESLKLSVCMDIMDLLYEGEETLVLYDSPFSTAAAILVAAYLLTVPKQAFEFPILPWVKSGTSTRKEEIVELVRIILHHILRPSNEAY